MTPADNVNGAFEMLGGVLLLLNVRRLYLDKKVHGVSIPVTAFFSAWGLWNLYYYPSLGQWMSFYGGLVICWANMLWVGMAVHYSRRHPAVENDPEPTDDR